MLLATFVTEDKSSSRRGAKLSPSETKKARLRRCGGELAFPWRGGGLRRPHFFLRRKKCGKESRLDLRSKDPLARGGQVQIWRCWLRGIGAAGDVVGSGDRLYLLRRCRWCGARVGAGALAVFGDYQIAPIAARSTAMGRWRLTPPGYGGICLPAGRSADLTRHRRVIQHREPCEGKAWACAAWAPVSL